MMTVFETIEQDNKRIYRRGKKEGREEGRKEAILSYIKNMLKENLPIDLISKITGISPQEINKMK